MKPTYMNRTIIRQPLYLLLLIFSISGQMQARENVLNWQNDHIRIELKEQLEIPEMKWPETLLRYKLDLADAGISDVQELVLLDSTNRSVPFQLADRVSENGMIRYATLCFLSDLSSGATKTFRFTKRTDKMKYSLLSHPNKVKTESIASGILLDNGLVRLQINEDISGTTGDVVFRIGTAGEWLGEMLLPPGHKLTKYEVKNKVKGEVFSEYDLNLCFEGTKNYHVTLRLISGMEYVEMDETMNGFDASAHFSMQLNWDNFQPEVRYVPTRNSQVDKKGRGFDNYSWEPMEGLPFEGVADKHPLTDFDQQNASDGKLPFRLSSYHNWMTWWRLHTAAFWNEKKDQTVGIYIHDFEKWKDPSYPIWGSKEYLSVNYYYKDNRLFWKFPLVNGERSVSIALYPHAKDKEIVNQTNNPLVYIDYLRRWYGWISLDKTKDWVLDYESERSAHRPFYACEGQEMKADPKGVLEKFRRNVQAMATSGERINGPNPVGAREYLEHLTPLLELSEDKLSPADYRKVRAYYLFMNYVFIDEALMPIRTLLSGHPNFLGDIKSIPGAVAFLYPDHPDARMFADHFEKSIELNLNYHIRPEVKSWGAKGGRSTENLSCYTWAFLRPTLKTTFMLHHYYDGKNRMLHPNVSSYGEWLLNTLTSPLDLLNGRRAVPPQGAHSRKEAIPNYLNTLGHELRYYDPLLAEHIFWETRPDDDNFETRKKESDPWDAASRSLRPYEKGTNPRLQSAKYTGYGYVLRKNYGEKEEMYVNLQQIDDGPNYRWGRAGKGGNGIIYYYANGKRYSHNGTEDVGDGPFGDTERSTNFGVKKQGIYRGIGDYRSVGRNDLTEPLFDFGFAQFASVHASHEVSSDYTSRSVLMADKDYIMVFDDVVRPDIEGRLSWFVGINDELPAIYQLKPAVEAQNADVQLTVSPYHKDAVSPETKGVYFDGKGDFLTLVTHRADLDITYESDICRVKHPSGVTDWVFRNDNPVLYRKEGIGFEGTSGFVRKCAKGHYQAALFGGTMISVPGLSVRFESESDKNGISLELNQGLYSGKIRMSHPAMIRFTADKKQSSAYSLYLNGLPVNTGGTDGKTLLLNLDPGTYEWQLTDKGLIPGQPEILRSISGRNWCELSWTQVAGASSYQLWTSDDSGVNWKLYKDRIQATTGKIESLAENKKIHVRIVAEAAGGSGIPSGDYPVYLSADRPHAPEGLRVEVDKNVASLSWGQILGADNYNLYQRELGLNDFRSVYIGKERKTQVLLKEGVVYEFAVTATNGNGESSKSILVDTDPSRFINWSPVPGEKFRRDAESQENGYVEFNPWMEDAMQIFTYPE